NARDILRLLGVERATNPERQQLGVASDGVERGAQLVAHAGEKFRFCLAGRPRFFFRFLALFDVDADAEPGVDVACLIAARATSRQEPAISAVPVSKPHLYVVFVPLFYSLLPAPVDPVAVIGVDCVGPSVADRLTLGETRIVVPVRVAVADLSIGLTEPDDLRRQLEEALEFCSSGNAPALESCHAPGGHEENDADDRENQSDL